jgi:hypothetical protein
VLACVQAGFPFASAGDLAAHATRYQGDTMSVGAKLKVHRIEIRTERFRAGWTYHLDVDNAGAYETDRTFLTRQAAIEAAALRLIREVPILVDQDLLEQPPEQGRGY